MDGPAHYRRADEIMAQIAELADRAGSMTPVGMFDAMLAQAAVHAQLATAAATIDAATFDRTTWTDRDGRDWTGAELPESWRTVLQ
ncbi:hypothetical protein [Phycicoccus sp.]|uniref:hypothetical protein n=1 Tax=Phycicoccus sp. TaxID=1902410 RepID=UPI002C6C12A6|nr:hypothetical protein [Phycicoccus sp.]HMM95306.1 hypothetical protein [Phycicoccus sp.]